MKYKPNVKQQWTRRKLMLKKTFSVESASSSIRQMKNSLRRDPRVFAISSNEAIEQTTPSPRSSPESYGHRSSIATSHFSLEDCTSMTMLHNGSVTSL